ncbi:alpha/beta hydrolase family protein [Hymenobacter lapidiphilus]|uniref:Alpha/beta fold hydrolase n=1 Tax=Hymenobacter lapidiphilus TaxID=2608003 RepID=A0A7Y7PN63_9BACT|nr:alpha/beta fold hydrolase [Hymenobacter lapidiphilus]NVO30911.1 alpha/beta fold hydrolase [Hymenobacter lapidiphilus]
MLNTRIFRSSVSGWAVALLWLTLLGVAPGCKSNSPEPTVVAPPTSPPPVAPPAPVLVGSSLIGEYTPAELAARVADIPLVGALARYPVRVYRLTYTTRSTDGQAVTASGAVLVPVAPAAVPVISYQHGTLQPDEENRAPSYYSSRSEIWSAVSVLAATGYVVSAPDYLGYGASKALPHPYEHGASLASASADMLRATREFCEQQKININQKNFLLGYSEGGYATMALHQLLEEKYAATLPVTASAPGAGAYHKSAFAKYILNSTEPLNFLSTYVWVLRTYDRVYQLNRPLSYYYQQPYANRLQADPFSAVPRQAAELFAPTFRQAVLTNSDLALTATLTANDVYDWQPRAPLALFHGTQDDYVPFFNSEDAYKAMRARGATNVELWPIQGGTHFSAAPVYTLQAYAFISQF